MPTDLLVITEVMLAAGAVGGLVNWFLSEAPKAARLAWWQHMVIGITAAFMVPLFLTMISADLIGKIRGTPGQPGQPGDPVLLLNLAGFCLVASVSSRAFIGSLTERLMREVRDIRAQADAATDTAEQARQRAADATEAALTAQADAGTAQELARAQVVEEPLGDTVQDGPADPAPRQRSGPPTGAGLSMPPALAQERQVLQALMEGDVVLRSVAGLVQDSRLDEVTVVTVLGHLQQKGWALPLPGSDGRPRWFATAAGKAQARVALA
jgi:hypothetical protein